ncbi:hypothetical protein HYALB_00013657 [Hymenoscyphus albidus]|uniref:pectinesterase n=1 Tax=Hymenoscyphus albidus TaxID=595503 RepID=A0A9N9QBD4_9HELO|nr:hypothetical protein HYALB_00013657 [Hymenoscyphus albidus]
MKCLLTLAVLFNSVFSSPFLIDIDPSILATYNRTVPAAGAIVVDATGSVSGSHKTIQAGIDALSNSSTSAQTLFIYPGTYKEQAYIPKLASTLTIQGSTPDARTYAGNAATITYNLALKDTTSNDLTATLRNWSPNTKIYNLNIVNTFGHISKDGQNLAISAQATNQGYYACQFRGYQDTILTNTGKQLYAKSLITGAVDFIYGSAGIAWFEKVDIRTIANGAITASGRDSSSNPSWFVISNSNVDGINSTIASKSTYLGRPWREYARVVFQNTYIGAIVKDEGWSVWSSSESRTGHVNFEEYANTGPGSTGTRSNFSTKRSSAVQIEKVLGSGYLNEWWVDAGYL